ncbi:MAG: hypothetical protein JNJ88_20350 [Planctomycetes bacterium]|nr:hypothetical protein [Planctomycetota bacterium]
MQRSVQIQENGRSGHVIYQEGAQKLSFYWEFGGGDVVVVIQTGSAADWSRHGWALGRRREILQFTADEVIRQKAPSCLAEIDEARGDILLKSGPPPVKTPATGSGPSDAAGFVRRYRTVRSNLALVALGVAVLIGGVYWMGKKMLLVQPGKGAPIARSFRTDQHVATLISKLEPYFPSLHRDGSKDTYELLLQLTPLDGAEPEVVSLASGLPGGAAAHARILGVSGGILWAEATGIYGVDLQSRSALTQSDVQSATKVPNPSRADETMAKFKPESQVAAGMVIEPDRWMGLHSEEEYQSDFRAGQTVRSVAEAQNSKVQRRLYGGTLGEEIGSGRRRISEMSLLGSSQFYRGGILRRDADSKPVRLTQPEGVLILYNTDEGSKSTASLARVDDAGAVLWNVDTGLDRFSLAQILPSTDYVAFIGNRPPIPDKVSEPLIVLVNVRTGKHHTHSLAR